MNGIGVLNQISKVESDVNTGSQDTASRAAIGEGQVVGGAVIVAGEITTGAREIKAAASLVMV